MHVEISDFTVIISGIIMYDERSTGIFYYVIEISVNVYVKQEGFIFYWMKKYTICELTCILIVVNRKDEFERKLLRVSLHVLNDICHETSKLWVWGLFKTWQYHSAWDVL